MSKKELELRESKQQKEPKGRWSDCGQIFFEGSEGYGLKATLQTSCLGNENDIKKFFSTGEINKELNSTQIQVLTQIQEYRKEEGYGQPDTGGTGMERAANYGAVRGKQKTTRSLASRKRFPLRKVR